MSASAALVDTLKKELKSAGGDLRRGGARPGYERGEP